MQAGNEEHGAREIMTLSPDELAENWEPKDKPRTNRQHFVPQFYLKNFAIPPGSKSVLHFDLQTKLWELRSTKSVGCATHNLSYIDESGKRSDLVDQFMQDIFETPTVSVIQACTSPFALTPNTKSSLARFIAMVMARNPELQAKVSRQLLDGMKTGEVADDVNAELEGWLKKVKLPIEQAELEYIKANILHSTVAFASFWKSQLLEWHWTLMFTPPCDTFVTSDWPVHGRFVADGSRFVTCPLSPTRAVMISESPKTYRNPRVSPVEAVNVNTLMNATRFVVATSRDFSGSGLAIGLWQPASS